MDAGRIREELVGLRSDLRSAVGFLTRLPAGPEPGDAGRPPDFTRAARTFPLVGAIVGAAGGLVLLAAGWVGLGPLLAAALAVLTTYLVTGGLHEDGLADTMDGFGSGAGRERTLEIMDDSRIGTHGGAALVLSLLLRTAALAGIAAAASPLAAALALVAAEAVSRTALVWLWHALPAARPGGLADRTGPPDAAAMATALAAAVAIAAVVLIPLAGAAALAAGALFSAAATYIVMRAAARRIGGITGDVLGACQQVAAIAFLIGVAAGT